MRCVRTLTWFLPCLLWLSAGTALGQEAPEGEADPAGEGEESPELRALRLAEVAMFGQGQPLVDATNAPWLSVGEPPPAFTSDAPAAGSPSRERPRLAWLQGLELPNIPIRWDDKVVSYLEFYRDDPQGHSIMRAWLERERSWGPMVRAKLRELGLPEDLAYVAMIESGYDPTVRSRAGAVGMWQFVRRTGEEFGLEVSHWVDERMDPEQATVAGARYLEQLHRRFGSWELAFAAYNMGYGALLRSIRKYNTNDYWVLAELEAGLPFETTYYVAKVMACAIVGRNPARFGFTDVGDDESGPVRFARVEVPGGTTLPQIARAAGVETDAIVALNPALRRQRVPPGDARQVRIPEETRERFARAWTRRRPQNPAHRSYTLRFGETLDEVARRFRTSESALRSLNELEENEHAGAGLAILVPAVEPREDAAGGDDDEGPEIVAVPEDLALPGRRRIFYQVTDEDTCTSIAAHFGVTIDDLRSWNHVDPTAELQPGMYVQLFVSPERDLADTLFLDEDEVRVMVVDAEEFFDFYESQHGRVRFRYTVRQGDTLIAIGRRFDLSVGSLARINQFSRATDLRAGDEIIVYAPRDRVPARVRAEVDARIARAAESRGEAPPTPGAPTVDDGDGTDDAADRAAAREEVGDPAGESSTAAAEEDGDVLEGG